MLLANTYRDLAISDRAAKVHFTQQVVDYLKPHPVLLMTGFDLYRLVEIVVEDEVSEQSIVDRLYSEKGVFRLDA